VKWKPSKRQRDAGSVFAQLQPYPLPWIHLPATCDAPVYQGNFQIYLVNFGKILGVEGAGLRGNPLILFHRSLKAGPDIRKIGLRM
jgi:hypothetical protein